MSIRKKQEAVGEVKVQKNNNWRTTSTWKWVPFTLQNLPFKFCFSVVSEGEKKLPIEARKDKCGYSGDLLATCKFRPLMFVQKRLRKDKLILKVGDLSSGKSKIQLLVCWRALKYFCIHRRLRSRIETQRGMSIAFGWQIEGRRHFAGGTKCSTFFKLGKWTKII